MALKGEGGEFGEGVDLHDVLAASKRPRENAKKHPVRCSPGRDAANDASTLA